MYSKMPIQHTLRYSLSEIESRLDQEIIGIERVVKIYGSNANSFIIKCTNKKNKLNKYILKFSRDNHIENEIAGQRAIEKFIPTPEIVLTSKRKFWGLEWALYKFAEGSLMIEKLYKAETSGGNKNFIKLEQRKESILKKLHSQQETTFTKKQYLESRTNLLFYRRLAGSRFNEFFHKSPRNISKYFDKRIKLNGRIFEYTIDEIFQKIKEKYSEDIGNIPVILGHGDAHHGNIITDGKMWFIDNEYAGYMTPYAELAKPYYNDFVGILFFHYEKLLKSYFKIEKFREDNDKINIQIKKFKKMDLRLETTQIKLDTRKATVTKNNKDYLSLNDYLILCHTLTKDPNNYSPYRQKLFLAFTVILSDFDAFSPASIYSYF